MSLADRDRRVMWHPYTQVRTAMPPLAIVRGEGAWLVTEDGRRILDGIRSWWTNIHGHSNPRLNGALARQAAKLEHVLFAGFTHEPAVELAERLVEILPRGLTRVFYSDDGSTAVEVALKMAWQYWRNRGDERRTTFVALEHAYHGDTFGAMAASAGGVFTEPFEPLLFGVERVVDATALETLLGDRGDEIAAVIIEPMLQGAGGMIVWPKEFVSEVRRLCDRAGALLIADEVLTGFGRTGRMFACEHAGIAPDIICLAKGLTAGYLPLGATVATDAIYEAFLSDDRTKTFFHGHSYTANPLACAVAAESLAIFRDAATLERVREIEIRLTRSLDELRKLPAVRDARGIGAVAALELDVDQGYLSEAGPRLYSELLARGILLRPLGNVLYFMPPYVVTDGEIDMALRAMREVVEAPF